MDRGAWWAMQVDSLLAEPPGKPDINTNMSQLQTLFLFNQARRRGTQDRGMQSPQSAARRGTLRMSSATIYLPGLLRPTREGV